MLFKPVDVKGSERGGVVACRGIVPGMRLEMYRPTVTMVVSSKVHILLGGYGKDSEQLFLGVTQVNLVHLRLHGLTPPVQASQADPARHHWDHPQGLHLVPYPQGRW